MKIDKLIFNLILIIFILVAIQDVFIDQYSPYRIITQITQLMGVIIGVIAFFRFIKKKKIFSLVFNRWFLIFFFLLCIYAIFSNHIIDWFPRVLYTLLPFFVFFNYSKYGYDPNNKLTYTSLLLFLPALLMLCQSFFEREAAYGSFMERADNIGYSLLSIMMLFSVLKPNKSNLILITIAYFAILFSLKRGAMLTGTIIYMFYILQFKKFGIRKISLLNVLTLLCILAVSIYGIITYSDVFLYRFIRDQTASGREQFYTLVYKGWKNSSSFNQVFGNGFFSTVDYLGKVYSDIYAHSDWLEILYDHGILGIIIFSGTVISLFSLRKKIKLMIPYYYLPFVAIFFVFFIKTIISGTYMSKFDSITYGIFGLIQGQLLYESSPQNIFSKRQEKRDFSLSNN